MCHSFDVCYICYSNRESAPQAVMEDITAILTSHVQWIRKTFGGFSMTVGTLFNGCTFANMSYCDGERFFSPFWTPYSLLKRKKNPCPHRVEENCCNLPLICIPQPFLLAGQIAAFLSLLVSPPRNRLRWPLKMSKATSTRRGRDSLTLSLTKEIINNALNVEHPRGFGE